MALSPAAVKGLVGNLTAKLASTDDAKLSALLETVLPQLLTLLGFPDAAVRAQVMELVSHVNTRVKSQPDIKLPVAKILALWSNVTLKKGSPFILNFANLFLKMSYERATAEDKVKLLPTLLKGIHQHKRDHQQYLLSMVLQGLQAKVAVYSNMADLPLELKGKWSTGQPLEDFLYQYYKPHSADAKTLEADVDVLMSFLRAYIMYPPGTTLVSKTPPGMSLVDVRMVLNGKESLSTSEVLPVKLFIIKFIRAHLRQHIEAKTQGADEEKWLASNALALGLSATGDGHHEVVSAADTFVKQFLEPILDLDDKKTLTRLYQLILGNKPQSITELRTSASQSSTEPATPNSSIPLEMVQSSCLESIQIKALSLLSKSLTAVNDCWPTNLFLIQRSLSDHSGKRKLLVNGLEFLMYMLNNGQAASYQPYASELLEILLATLATLRSSSATAYEATNARGSLYVAIGYLCKQCKSLIGHRVELVNLYFDCLDKENNQIKSSVQEGLAHLCAALWPLQSTAGIEELLVGNAKKEGQDQCQLAAIQCANKLFDFDHAPSRMMALMLSTHTYMQIREECSKGLQLSAYKQQRQQFESVAMELRKDASEPYKVPAQLYPDFSQFVVHVCKDLEIGATTTHANLHVSPQKLTTILKFCFSCLIYTANGNENCNEDSAKIASYIQNVTNDQGKSYQLFLKLLDLCLSSTADMVAGTFVSAEAALNPNNITLSHSLVPQEENLPIIPLLIILHLAKLHPPTKKRYADQSYIETLQKLLVKAPKGVRETVPMVLEVLAVDMGSEELSKLMQNLSKIHDLANDMSAISSNALSLNALHGAMLGYASLVTSLYASGCPQDNPLKKLKTHNDLIIIWYKLLVHLNPMIVSAACQSLGMMGKCGGLADLLPEGDEEINTDLEAEDKPLDVSVDPNQTSEAFSIQCLTRGLLYIVKTHSNNRIVDTAIHSMGAISLGLPVGNALKLIVKGLFSIVVSRLTAVSVSAKKKDKNSAEEGGYQGEETQFTYGEVIAAVCGGSCAAGRDDYAVTVVKKLLGQFTVHRIPAIRRASAIWMLCVVQLCGKKLPSQATTTADEEVERLLLQAYPVEATDYQQLQFRSSIQRGHRCVMDFLKDYQKAFQYLLTDSNEIAQEAASKGLTLVYSLGDKDMQQTLVDSLVDMLSGDKKQAQSMKVEVEDDTELFPSGYFSEAPKGTGVGSLSTYKDICNLANEMGKPDLIYHFMSLASHHSVWNSKRAAAFGAANIIRANFESIRPQLHAILPKLYRNKFDPNSRIADSMQAMWDSMMPTLQESRKAVDENIGPIAKEVIAGLNHHQYRIREASLLALMDLLGGRQWSELGKYIVEALPMMFRVMDDIKETTAKVAMSCSRSVHNFIIKACTIQYSTAELIHECLKSTIPILVEKGFDNPCQEVVKYTANLVMKICQVSGVYLKPFLPDLVSVCLEYTSALEPREFQYLQNLGDAKMTTEDIEGVRAKLTSATPLAEALKFCQPHCDSEVMVGLMPRLMDLLKHGVGLPTRSATAHFVGLAAKFHAPAIAPYVPRLLEVCTQVLKHEQSFTVKRAIASAVAYVFRNTPEAHAETLVRHMATCYMEEEGCNESDDGIRVTAGVVLQEITELAADKLVSELVHIMPVAYLAMFDTTEKAKDAWATVWRSNSGGDREGVNKYYKDILVNITTFLDHLSWKKRTQAAQCLAAICKQRHVDQQELLDTTIAIFKNYIPSGRTWEGKETLFEAVSAFFDTCCHVSTNRALAPQLDATVVLVHKECSRQSKKYRLKAHRALVSLLASAYKHRELTGVVDATVYIQVLDDIIASLQGMQTQNAGNVDKDKDKDEDDMQDHDADKEWSGRDGSSRGVQADVQSQLVQGMEKGFLAAYPNEDTARERRAPLKTHFISVLETLIPLLQETSATHTQRLFLNSTRGVMQHMESLLPEDDSLMTSNLANQIFEICTKQTKDDVDRDVRVAAVDVMVLFFAFAKHNGSQDYVERLSPLLEAMAKEEDVTIRDHALKYLKD